MLAGAVTGFAVAVVTPGGPWLADVAAMACWRGARPGARAFLAVTLRAGAGHRRAPAGAFGAGLSGPPG